MKISNILIAILTLTALIVTIMLVANFSEPWQKQVDCHSLEQQNNNTNYVPLPKQCEEGE